MVNKHPAVIGDMIFLMVVKAVEAELYIATAVLFNVS